ncbi:hypothetical protein [Endozoicomonas sp. ISHI1]|uniref:hypothetical protein n=1 Tax=Endozoicomonas sp. ISHI1 TaxID=2825882 RepID=UPI002147900E|nr:hypothetical protein [Endozoicomonas sp. ISHI1]
MNSEMVEKMNIPFSSLDRFPSVKGQKEDGKNNPAIQLYGRRYFKDQTSVEYLAELLLVFLSPKGDDQNNEYSFSIANDKLGKYWPKAKTSLKLFSFFSGSKLETRHPEHQIAYLQALTALKDNMDFSDNEKDNVIRLFQSLLGGFVGVSKNRTWVAQNFLPLSPSLIAREVGWRHSDAIKAGINHWSEAEQHFDTSSHMFMARGGEMLFLQLSHLFSKSDTTIKSYFENNTAYKHLSDVSNSSLKQQIEDGLKSLLTGAVKPVAEIASFIEKSLEQLSFDELEKKEASLGWVPTTTIPEAFLFAIELNNIVNSSLSDLEKLDLLQTLCSMQVLRNLCFQAYRTEHRNNEVQPFIGQYAWVVSDPKTPPDNGIRKIAQKSFEQIEEVLYRALSNVSDMMAESGATDIKMNDALKHGFQIFRKTAKDIGLVIPPAGQGQRFVLTPKLLRFLVISLIEPGQRVRLTEFYKRVFAHYGIALGELQLATALSQTSNQNESQQYAIAADTTWVEESLQQGGFLVELSDAVSIVVNLVGMEQS